MYGFTKTSRNMYRQIVKRAKRGDDAAQWNPRLKKWTPLVGSRKQWERGSLVENNIPLWPAEIYLWFERKKQHKRHCKKRK